VFLAVFLVTAHFQKVPLLHPI